MNICLRSRARSLVRAARPDHPPRRALRRGWHWLGALLLALLALQTPMALAAAGIRVTYPTGDVPNDPRFNDVIEILRTALEKTRPQYGPFELGPAKVPMPKARYLLEMENQGDINVVWNGTSDELEQRFAPIRISLRKDLLGYRICLINKGSQKKIDQVKTVEDLKQISIGQGIGWGDNRIYENIGIEVVKAKYGQLFKMLSMNRFELYPRGIGEVFTEYDLLHAEHPTLAVEKNLVLYYPWPYYFFFNRNDVALRQRVETGLHIMQQDGSFDAIFRKYNQAAIEKANLKGRRIIRLTNPLLPKNTPAGDPSLWYDPNK